MSNKEGLNQNTLRQKLFLYHRRQKRTFSLAKTKGGNSVPNTKKVIIFYLKTGCWGYLLLRNKVLSTLTKKTKNCHICKKVLDEPFKNLKDLAKNVIVINSK